MREALLGVAMRRLVGMKHVGLTERLDQSVLSLAATLGAWRRLLLRAKLGICLELCLSELLEGERGRILPAWRLAWVHRRACLLVSGVGPAGAGPGCAAQPECGGGEAGDCLVTSGYGAAMLACVGLHA